MTKIREARRIDAATLLAIYRPFVTDCAVSFEREPPSVTEFEGRIADALDQWAWLVAENDSGPVASPTITGWRRALGSAT